MTRYLLAAEADKIQDLLFRSARLREVAGGSQLLARFCQEVPAIRHKLRGDEGIEFLMHAGGGFRVLFDDKNKAWEFGQWLAELYARVSGGTLTLARPIPFNTDAEFAEAYEQADSALREAKSNRATCRGEAHMPYSAFCVSCGVGLAAQYDTASDAGSERRALCPSCLTKAETRLSQKWEFLQPLSRILSPENPESCKWPGDDHNQEATADLAAFDDRSYVAYLMADGNDMGRLFGSCANPSQLTKLSECLTQSIWEALAEPVKLYRIHQLSTHRWKHSPRFIPLYPLIVGGDDIFVLIPARWALHSALLCCQTFAAKMAQRMRELGPPLDTMPVPTLTAAVVLCKASYPYALAHRAAETLLKRAKPLCKQLQAQYPDYQGAAVDFQVVLGNVLEEDYGSDDRFRPTLKPYWTHDTLPPNWGVPLNRILDHRKQLARVSQAQLASLRAYLLDLQGAPDENKKNRWKAGLGRLLDRLTGASAGPDVKQRVETALADLGSGSSGTGVPHWLSVDRSNADAWTGHGLPDLLAAWEFAFKLDEASDAYEGEED